jgi:ATP-dependent DNA helicase RecG
MPSLDRLNTWLTSKENEHLECKEAKRHFDFERLVKYCVALANEGREYIVLGVTDKPPRSVVGSQAFDDIERTKAGLVERLHLRIDCEEIDHPDGRVVAFHVPSRPFGAPIAYDGAYWMRAGEDLVPMTPDMLKRIFAEAGPDFSAEICANATLGDLDPVAIGRFRTMWARKAGNKAVETLSGEQTLRDAELLMDGGVTYAALVLFGTHNALGKHLAQAEVVFEYRSSEASIPYQQRKEFRQGFFLFDDELLGTINLRNEVQQFRSGLFMWDIPTLNENVVREAVLNCHRDYRLAGSVFVRQFPRRLEIISPGGFPPGITEKKILWKQSPRNRRIAEACSRCGLVERSGQGMNRMYEQCIRESKPIPDFAGTDEYQVSVTLLGEVQDTRFLRFLEQVGDEQLAQYSTSDLMALRCVYREERVPEETKGRLASLENDGIVERVGRGRGTRYILSRRFHAFLDQKGVYTRKAGLDRETNKALLLKHIKDNAKDGSRLQELLQVLPGLSRDQVQKLLRKLMEEDRITVVGTTRAARWYPVTRES